MNDENSEKSHARAWLLGVLALPLVYVLSAPPVFFTTWRMLGMPYRPPGAVSTLTRPPHWAMTYVLPYDWLVEETPLKRPLQRYADLWARLLLS